MATGSIVPRLDQVARIEQLESQYSNMQSTINTSLSQCPYAVGDIYMTTSSTAPATRWPNTTWEQIKDKFLLAAGDSHSNGETGGREYTSIKRAIDEATGFGVSTTNTGFQDRLVVMIGGATAGEVRGNMPPYLTVNMYIRVS